MVAVVGISTSSRAELDQALAKLGTNLLTVSPGRTVSGEDAKLPTEATAMVGRIGPVQSVAATGQVDAYVYRNEFVPAGQTSSVVVLAAGLNLPQTVGATMSSGSWLNPATSTYPGVVLGSRAATRLDLVTPGMRVWLGRRWFSVTGILKPVPLAPELDSAALIGWEAGERYAGFDGHPTTVYARSEESQIVAVRAVLGRTANPEAPNEVAISRPSDALAAKQATDDALTALLLGLGAVALLVGGVGVANTMVISVLERRTEIGLRRSLGATRRHIRLQFLTESLILSGIGGGGGILLGVIATGGYALTQGWPTVVPGWATAGGFGATLVIGALAGLYPALRASRMAPAEALATS
jgi:putative ABC transport system permease protein